MTYYVIAAILCAALMLKLKINISYADGDLETELRLSVFLIPTGEKNAKSSKKPLFEKEDLPSLSRALLYFLDELGKKIVIEKLKISCIPADPDPYNAVMKYNMINAVLGSALPFAEKLFRVNDKEIYTALDLDSQRGETKLSIRISIRVLWLLRPGLRLGSEMLRIIAAKRRKRGKQWRTNSVT